MPGSIAAAAAKPYRVSLIGGEFDGKDWKVGLRVELDDGWKTYWRMPGDAGIPPRMEWKTSKPARIELLYPVPSRFSDGSGETIGFKHDVVFPVIVTPQQDGPLRLDLELFLGVCRDVCIPVQSTASIELGTSASDPEGAGIVAEWLAKVPRHEEFVADARLETVSGKPVLALSLVREVEDIFVEAPGQAYFHEPQFSADRRTARLAIGNVKDPETLRQTPLKLTASNAGQGLEQSITLA